MKHVGTVLSAPYSGPFFWTVVASCLQPEAARQGIQLTKRAAATARDQALGIQELLDQAVDAIVIKPLFGHQGELVPALDRALSLSVPVITIDSKIDHPAVRATVGSDNYQGMKRATWHAFDVLQGNGKVVYFAGDERLSAGTARNIGFHEVLQEFPGIQLLQQESLDWVSPVSRIETASQCMRRVLARHKSFDALVAAGDEAAIGGVNALRAAQAAGTWTGQWPVVVGFNGLAEALLLVQSGGMTGTIAQSPEWIARTALEMACECSDHPQSAWVHRFVDSQLVTQDNVSEHAYRFLNVVPRFIEELGESQTRERQLQEQVISRQRSALNMVSATSAALAKSQSPDQMVEALLGQLREAFPALDTMVYTAPAPPSLNSPAIPSEAASRDDVFGAAWQWRLASGASQRVPLPAADADWLTAVLSNLHNTPDTETSSSHWDPSRQSTLFPLITKGTRYGVMDVRSTHGKPLPHETVQLLEAIAHQLSLAFETASLHQETLRLTAAELKAAQEKLVHAERAEFLANHDPLTGLPNRRSFAALLERTLNEARRYGRSFALYFLDLDGFKRVNDTLGHEAGDQLLQEVASRLKLALRRTDTVARMGGDEFVVLVPQLIGPEHAASVAEKVISAFAQPFQLSASSVPTTTSVGAAIFPTDAQDVAALMRMADSAMYEAKRSGKNRYVLAAASRTI
ncbi:diguanylate cyclase domain-containing protein [Piscinibacter sp. HJYY11]|uniref:diguanylate cyclase domain-containing protein n=1 Tax=Piscinibacter sp. HJYY11 TaxID=2801333 RepID=UPI00191DE0F5|nr:diguanylate cyclase [Piscinibacter sp. HJYY11]MBL0727221.1 diguanylate cyclase [Piscinibacter sp. HJYY11]